MHVQPLNLLKGLPPAAQVVTGGIFFGCSEQPLKNYIPFPDQDLIQIEIIGKIYNTFIFNILSLNNRYMKYFTENSHFLFVQTPNFEMNSHLR